MANELSYSLNVSYASGYAKDSVTTGTVTYSQSTQLVDSGIQDVGTAAESLATGDVGTNGGWLWMKNLDTTNYVTFGPDSTGLITCGRLQPGKDCWFFLAPSVTLKVQANTAACKVQYKLFNI